MYVFKRGKYGVKTSSGSSAAKKQKVADPASGKFCVNFEIGLLAYYWCYTLREIYGPGNI